MSYRILVAAPAENDLREAVFYISHELKNNAAALRLLDEAEETIRSLREMPFRYAVIEDDLLGNQGVRMVRVKNYLLFYVVRDDAKTVTVLRFLYARRDWLSILCDE